MAAGAGLPRAVVLLGAGAAATVVIAGMRSAAWLLAPVFLAMVVASYLLANGSNHPELDAVTTTFRRYEHNLPLSVPEAYRDGETYALGHPSDRTLRPGGTRTVGMPGSDHITDQNGNLMWGLHNVWLSYRHSMDRRVLRHALYPILGKAVNFYSHFLIKGADGHLHLPTTRSPEYANAPDATYDLSLIRWACRILVDTARQLHIADPRLPRWREVLTRLTPYHEDPAAGVIIGDGVPLADSHRHYSHLLWLYPLRERCGTTRPTGMSCGARSTTG